MNQVCFQVIGTDATIAAASEAGQLQLNVFEPVIVYNLLNNMNWFLILCCVKVKTAQFIIILACVCVSKSIFTTD